VRRGASQLLGLRVGFEQRSYIFSAEKISELVPRQTACGGKRFSRGRIPPSSNGELLLAEESLPVTEAGQEPHNIFGTK